MIIRNGKIVTWGEPNEILEGKALLIQDGLIQEIGNESDLLAAHHGEEVLDAQGQLVMPGLICAHTHFYGAFSRGMAVPGEPSRNFQEILANLWWKLDKGLDEDGVRYSALALLADATRYGCTTLLTTMPHQIASMARWILKRMRLWNRA